MNDKTPHLYVRHPSSVRTAPEVNFRVQTRQGQAEWVHVGEAGTSERICRLLPMHV